MRLGLFFCLVPAPPLEPMTVLLAIRTGAGVELFHYPYGPTSRVSPLDRWLSGRSAVDTAPAYHSQRLAPMPVLKSATATTWRRRAHSL